MSSTPGDEKRVSSANADRPASEPVELDATSRSEVAADLSKTVEGGPTSEADGKASAAETEELDAKIDEGIDTAAYVPRVDKGEWFLSKLDVAWIAEGGVVLSGGRGGSTVHAVKLAHELLGYGKQMRVRHMDRVPKDTIVLRGGYRDRPWLPTERMPTSRDIILLVYEMRQGRDICKNQPLGACISEELGGGNNVQTLILGSMGIAIIDADLQKRLEHERRAMIPDLAFLGPAPLYARDIEQYARHNAISACWWVGRALALCRHREQVSSIPSAIFEHRPGRLLYIGRVVKDSRSSTLYTNGHLLLEGTPEDENTEAQEGAAVFTGEAKLDINEGWSQFTSLKKPEGPPPPLYAGPMAEIWERRRDTVGKISAGIVCVDVQSGRAVEIHDELVGRTLSIIALVGDPESAYTEKSHEEHMRFRIDTDRSPFTAGFVSAIGEYHKPASVIESYGRARV